MHTNVKGPRYKTEKIKIHAKENRKGDFRRRERQRKALQAAAGE